jgi:HSP20 family molecular chaperone IbpA
MFYLKPKQKGEGRELVGFRDELDSLFSRSIELPAEVESKDVAAT